MSEVIIPIRIQDEGSAASLDQLVASFDDLANTIDSKPIEVKVDTAPAQASVDELIGQIDSLDGSAKPITLTANDAPALAAIDAVDARYGVVKETIQGEAITPVVDNLPADGEIAAVEGTYDTAKTTIQGDPIVLKMDNSLADADIATTSGEVDALRSNAETPMVPKLDPTLSDSELGLIGTKADDTAVSVNAIGKAGVEAMAAIMFMPMILQGIADGIDNVTSSGDRLFETKAGLDAITNGASDAFIAAGKLGSDGLIPQSDLIGVAFKALGTGAVTTAAQFQQLAQDGTALGLATGQGAAGGVDALGKAIESVGNKKMLKSLALDSDEVMSKWKELGDKGPEAAAHWQTAVMSVADAMAQKLDPTLLGQHVAWQQMKTDIANTAEQGTEQLSTFFNSFATGVKKAQTDSLPAFGSGSNLLSGMLQNAANVDSSVMNGGQNPNAALGSGIAGAVAQSTGPAAQAEAANAAFLKASGGLAQWESKLEASFPITAKSAQSQADLRATAEKAAEAYQKGVGPIGDVTKALDALDKGYVKTDDAATQTADSQQKAADAAKKFTDMKLKQTGGGDDDKPIIAPIPQATTDSVTKIDTALATTATNANDAAAKVTPLTTGIFNANTGFLNFGTTAATTNTTITNTGTVATALPTALLPPMTKSAENIALVTTAAQTAQDTLNNLLKTQGSVTIAVNGVNARPGAQSQ